MRPRSPAALPAGPSGVLTETMTIGKNIKGRALLLCALTLVALVISPLLVGGGGFLEGPAWAAEKAHDGEEHGSAFSWKTELFRLLNFLIVAVLLYKLLKGPIRDWMARRREGIEKALSEAREAREQAEALLREQRARVEHLQEELRGLEAEAARERELLRERLRGETEAAVKRLMDETKTTIELEGRKARAELQAKASALAVELAEELLMKNLDPEDQERLVEDYISKLGKEK